jgi:hypothetical protein
LKRDGDPVAKFIRTPGSMVTDADLQALGVSLPAQADAMEAQAARLGQQARAPI